MIRLIPQLNKTIPVDANGEFVVKLKPGSYQIVISARGYRTQRKEIKVPSAGTVLLNPELHR